MALLARQLYFEAVKVGDELPPLVKPPVDRTQIARYAGASGDFNPLHVDEILARNAGFPSAPVPAMISMGFLGELVVDWVRGARLRKFQARFVKIVWPGDVITCRGRVIDRRFEGDGVYCIDIELWSENQRGELVVKGLVTSQLYYSAEDDARQRGGQSPLVVTPEEEAARLAKLSRAQPPKQPEPRPPPPPPRPAPAPPVAAAKAPPLAPERVPPPSKPPPAKPPPASARPVAPERPAAQAPPAPAPPPAPARAVPVERAAPHSSAPKGQPVAAPPSPARAAARPRSAAGKRPTKPRAAPRPAARPKPAARASRPRAGSKPTGKKRR